MTGFYVSDVPKCQSYEDFCEYVIKAKKLSFVRTMNTKEEVEETVVYRVEDNNTTTAVNHKDLPWRLNYFTKEYIWPNEWRLGRLRPSVYWPSKYSVLFIIYSGLTYSSALLWNQISRIDWYRNLKRVKLNSDVPFVGMFHLNGKIFAIGGQSQNGQGETFVYLVRDYKNSLDVIPYVCVLS